MDDARRLLLLRHAKSSWDDPTLADFDRPLAERGRRASKLIAAHLREEQLEVSLILCSAARRARETLELVTPPGAVEIERGLYGASAGELLERLRKLGDDAHSVLLIGHNPAMHQLALELAADPGELATSKFPTAALATFTFTGPWRTLGAGTARLSAFVRPRELG